MPFAAEGDRRLSPNLAQTGHSPQSVMLIAWLNNQSAALASEG
jgi:hypothetical protein